MRLYFLLILIASLFAGCTPKANQADGNITTERSIKAENALKTAKEIRDEVAVQVADGLDLSLWASDSLIHDPISISIDEQGKIFLYKCKSYGEFRI